MVQPFTCREFDKKGTFLLPTLVISQNFRGRVFGRHGVPAPDLSSARILAPRFPWGRRSCAGGGRAGARGASPPERPGTRGSESLQPSRKRPNHRCAGALKRVHKAQRGGKGRNRPPKAPQGTTSHPSPGAGLPGPRPRVGLAPAMDSEAPRARLAPGQGSGEVVGAGAGSGEATKGGAGAGRLGRSLEGGRRGGSGGGSLNGGPGRGVWGGHQGAGAPEAPPPRPRAGKRPCPPHPGSSPAPRARARPRPRPRPSRPRGHCVVTAATVARPKGPALGRRLTRAGRTLPPLPASQRPRGKGSDPGVPCPPARLRGSQVPAPSQADAGVRAHQPGTSRPPRRAPPRPLPCASGAPAALPVLRAQTWARAGRGATPRYGEPDRRGALVARRLLRARTRARPIHPRAGLGAHRRPSRVGPRRSAPSL